MSMLPAALVGVAVCMLLAVLIAPSLRAARARQALEAAPTPLGTDNVAFKRDAPSAEWLISLRPRRPLELMPRPPHTRDRSRR